jgi:geranylgeranyl diphosphate synthase type I
MKKHWDNFFVPPEMDEFLDKVKIDFAKSFEVDDQFLSAWLSHHGESQGKWLRARLALATGGLLGISSQTYINWAVVCELIHSASLLHDDVCDQDNLRRGQTSLWKEFGISAAICTGDYLIAEAFRKITEIDQGWHQTILLKLLSCSVKEIIFGQSKDISISPYKMTWDQYTKMATHKTAPFISLPMMGMFECKECSKGECEGLQKSSNILGLSYQWLNDLENLIGIDQDKCTDIYNSHPNGMLINILKNLEESKKIEIIKDPRSLTKYLNEDVFKSQTDMIKNLLNEAKDEFHRVPKVIEPVLMSIFNEISFRMKNLDKVKK